MKTANNIYAVLLLDSDKKLIYADDFAKPFICLKEGEVWPFTVSFGKKVHLCGRSLDGVFCLNPADNSVFITYKKIKNESFGGILVNMEIKRTNTEASVTFIDSLLHEIRTPVNIINSAATVMAKSCNESAKPEKQLDIILKNGRTIRKLIGNIMMLLKENASAFSPNLVPVNLFSYFNDFAEALEPYARDKGFEISLTFPEKNPVILSDRDMLDRIFTNLASNAFKFYKKKKRIEIVVEEENDMARIYFKDFGRGIAKKDYKAIFNKYIAEKSLIRCENEGCGIGLHLVSRLVSAQNGTIYVHSFKGRWTEFVISLPLCKDNACAALTDSAYAKAALEYRMEEEMADVF